MTDTVAAGVVAEVVVEIIMTEAVEGTITNAIKGIDKHFSRS
jgi:hypothetical protein